MHNSGMFHRDLKPNNLLLTMPQGIVHIIDFGESIFSNKPTLDFDGAEGYSTPESVTSVPYIPSLMDVWVLGVTLYRMRFDVKPFGRRLLLTKVDGTLNTPIKSPHWTTPSQILLPQSSKT